MNTTSHIIWCALVARSVVPAQITIIQMATKYNVMVAGLFWLGITHIQPQPMLIGWMQIPHVPFITNQKKGMIHIQTQYHLPRRAMDTLYITGIKPIP